MSDNNSNRWSPSDDIKKVIDLRGGQWEKLIELSRRVYSPEGVAPTIHAHASNSDGTGIKICQKK